MKAGRLTHPVRVERVTESPNSYGEPVKTWAAVAYTRASIEPLRGDEKFQALQVQSDVDVKIRLRAFAAIADMSTKDRIVSESTGRVYDIKSVIDVMGRGREIEIMARLHNA